MKLQHEAAFHSGITSKDLLAIARAKASLGANIVGLDQLDPKATSSSSSGSSNIITPIQWADHITMSHVEVRTLCPYEPRR